jgi:hypothetical protein
MKESETTARRQRSAEAAPTEETSRPSNGQERTERRRQLLEAMKAARRQTSTDERERLMPEVSRDRSTESDATSGSPRPVSDNSRILEQLDLQEAAISAIAGVAKESHERLSQLEGMLPQYNAFTEALTDTLTRSTRQLEDTVLTLRRTEYLLGQMDDRNRRGQELLSRVEMLIQNVDGILSAGKRELQSEAIVMRRYIARKLRFAPLLLLVTSLLLAASALTWWNQGRVDGQIPIVGPR